MLRLSSLQNMMQMFTRRTPNFVQNKSDWDDFSSRMRRFFLDMFRAVLCLYVRMLTHGDNWEANIFNAEKGYFSSLISCGNSSHQSSEASRYEPTYLLGDLESVISRAYSTWSADTAAQQWTAFKALHDFSEASHLTGFSLKELSNTGTPTMKLDRAMISIIAYSGVCLLLTAKRATQ